MVPWYFISFLLVSTNIPSISCNRILFLLPLSSKSMANVFEPLAIALAERGHHLTVITPTKFKIPDSNKNATQMIPSPVDELFKDYPDPFDIRRQTNLFRFPMEFQLKHCSRLYDNPEFRKILSEKFDVVVVNTYYHECFAGLLHKMGSPVIQISSLPIASSFSEVWGAHQPSSFVPVPILNGDISLQMNFRQRVKNFLYNVYFSVMLNSWTRPPLESLYREKLADPGLPSVVEVFQKQVSLILVNAHFALTSPRPMLPNFVDIGGIHCRPVKPLPQDLEEFVNGATHGFIVFSLGSIVKAVNMPEPVRLAFLSAFAKLKERVIWKWEKDEGMEGLPENVKVVKWLPQQDLLGHPSIKLFITHGGLLSTEEAIYHGVPVLGMPIFIDQNANMKQAEILGFGVQGEILDLTEEKLTPFIRRVLDHPRYMKKAKELSEIFRDSMETPVERAVFWTEYVLRHKGAQHLKSAAMNLNLIQYYSIDVVAFLIGVGIIAILSVYYIVRLLLQIVFLLCGISKQRAQTTNISNKRKGSKIKNQ